MAIIEAGTVDGDLKVAVRWLKSWERNEYSNSSYYQDNALRYLDLAIEGLRRLDERGPLGLRNPALERLIPSLTDESSGPQQRIVSRLT